MINMDQTGFHELWNSCSSTCPLYDSSHAKRGCTMTNDFCVLPEQISAVKSMKSGFLHSFVIQRHLSQGSSVCYITVTVNTDSLFKLAFVLTFDCLTVFL